MIPTSMRSIHCVCSSSRDPERFRIQCLMLHGLILDLKTGHSSMQEEPGDTNSMSEQCIAYPICNRPGSARHLYAPGKSGEQGLVSLDGISWSIVVMDRLTYTGH